MRKFEVGCVYKRLLPPFDVPYMYVYKRKGNKIYFSLNFDLWFTVQVVNNVEVIRIREGSKDKILYSADMPYKWFTEGERYTAFSSLHGQFFTAYYKGVEDNHHVFNINGKDNPCPLLNLPIARNSIFTIFADLNFILNYGLQILKQAPDIKPVVKPVVKPEKSKIKRFIVGKEYFYYPYENYRVKVKITKRKRDESGLMAIYWCDKNMPLTGVFYAKVDKDINAEVVSLYDRYLMRADEVVEDADL